MKFVFVTLMFVVIYLLASFMSKRGYPAKKAGIYTGLGALALGAAIIIVRWLLDANGDIAIDNLYWELVFFLFLLPFACGY